jgi:hypothetical protein
VTVFAAQPGALLARGVCRALAAAGLAPVVEFSPAPGLRVDVIALGSDGRVTIVECKASVADWRSDAKWPGYLDWCDAFFFAAPPDFPFELLPPDEGLFAADPFGAEMLRGPSPRTLAAARRRALTLRLARAAAERLRRAQDPGLGPGGLSAGAAGGA